MVRTGRRGDRIAHRRTRRVTTMSRHHGPALLNVLSNVSQILAWFLLCSRVGRRRFTRSAWSTKALYFSGGATRLKLAWATAAFANPSLSPASPAAVPPSSTGTAPHSAMQSACIDARYGSSARSHPLSDQTTRQTARAFHHGKRRRVISPERSRTVRSAVARSSPVAPARLTGGPDRRPHAERASTRPDCRRAQCRPPLRMSG